MDLAHHRFLVDGFRSAHVDHIIFDGDAHLFGRNDVQLESFTDQFYRLTIDQMLFGHALAFHRLCDPIESLLDKIIYDSIRASSRCGDYDLRTIFDVDMDVLDVLSLNIDVDTVDVPDGHVAGVIE